MADKRSKRGPNNSTRQTTVRDGVDEDDTYSESVSPPKRADLRSGKGAPSPANFKFRDAGADSENSEDEQADEDVYEPPSVRRNAGAAAKRTMTFGTGSKLNKPAGLSIDIDDDDNASKKNAGPEVKHGRTISGSGMKQVETLKQGTNALNLSQRRATMNPLQSSEANRATPIVNKTGTTKISGVGSLSKPQKLAKK